MTLEEPRDFILIYKSLLIKARIYYFEYNKKMGLTKQYLTYKPVSSFNIIASTRPNINFVIYNKIEGRYCIVGGAENVILWDLKLGHKITEFKREKEEVTAIRASPDQMHIAVGYIDGVVQIFEISSHKCICSLALHKTAITILRYDSLGIRLISGSMDTELVITDIISQLGKNRLIGHNAPITDGHFLEDIGGSDICISSSKDTQIKFWDLHTQTCFKTLVDNRTEVWGLALISNLLVAGTGENTMTVYKITRTENSGDISAPVIDGLSLDDKFIGSPINVSNCGIIQRIGKGRTISLVADNTGRVLSCHGTNDVIEIFFIYSKEEALARVKKRLIKSTTTKTSSATEKLSNEITLSDEIKRLSSIKIGNKIKSLDIAIGLNDELRILINCANNTLQLHSLDLNKKSITSNTKLLRSISQCGHQSEVRTVCFSSDSLAIASGSGESMKLWNQNSLQCFKTIPTEYILSSCFVPGDRHVLLGMKNGKLLIVDIGTGEILEEISAHKEEIWSICLLPDLKGCVTGSSDSTVKIWSFELIEHSSELSSKSNILSLLHKNTLKYEETVLCVKVSSNGKFLAAGLLDSTVKIFFLDSFKFFLSLYGHKLPVLCMDISDDSTLIVTGSGDRNIKIWGLDFGDCHRSLFAHDDSVVSIQFIPKTHLFFSCGKDGKIKQWDADLFEKIVTLPGHIGQVYNLAVSPNGKLLITCGSDRTLRLFECTDEPIVLQDIQEQEREEIENNWLATDDNQIQTHPGLKLPSRKTVGSEKAAESILECLEICKKFASDNDSELHPLMIAYDVENVDDFLIGVLQRIRPADLEEALLLLPFSDVSEILQRIPKLSERRKDQTEIILRVTLFLLRIHHKPIVSNQTLLTVITKIRIILEDSTIQLRDMIGINLYAYKLLQRTIEESDKIELFTDSSKQKKNRHKLYKKRELKRIHIQLN